MLPIIIFYFEVEYIFQRTWNENPGDESYPQNHSNQSLQLLK